MASSLAKGIETDHESKPGYRMERVLAGRVIAMLTELQFLEMVAAGETLTVEFKGERRQQLSDNDIAEAVVCLTNADGGYLFLGVEDDGSITGSVNRNGDFSDVGKLAAKIYSRTMPNLHVEVQSMPHEARTVLVIKVPDSSSPVCTTRGVYVKRRIGGDGKPTCMPYLPHEMTSDAANRGALDYSEQKFEKLDIDAFDTFEIERLFSVIRNNLRSDKMLLELSQTEALKSLRLLVEGKTELVPTVAGLLLLGKKDILNSYIPHHELAFQFFKGTDVLINEFLKEPLLKSLETIWNYFTARNDIDSTVVNLYRRDIPDYDEVAFREAVNNAVSHRDYTGMGTVYIQWRDNQIEISNPGGFVNGVSLENILSVSPTPRNPLLADVFKRIGLVERSGRGVDLIYTGQLKYGRRIPGYSRTTSEKVVVTISKDTPTLDLIEFWQKHESEFSVSPEFEHRYIFDSLYRDKKDSVAEIAGILQRTMEETEVFMQQMIDWGYIKYHKPDGDYHLSPACKTKLKKIGSELTKKMPPKSSGKSSGKTVVKTVVKILEAIRSNPHVTSKELSSITGLSVRGIEWNLDKLKKAGDIQRVGPDKGGHWEVIEKS